MKLSDLFFHWEVVRRQMVEAVSRLSQEQLDWLPTNGKNSIADLLRHIAETEIWWFGVVVQGNKGLGDVSRNDAPDLQSILRVLENSHEYVADILGRESTDSWDTRIFTLPDNEKLTLRWIVWHTIEHEMRHRGQIFMLMRLQEITPPNV